jgi:hypothetical protein
LCPLCSPETFRFILKSGSIGKEFTKFILESRNIRLCGCSLQPKAF